MVEEPRDRDPVTLKEHFSLLLKEHEEKVRLRFEAQQLALEKAAGDMGYRLETMNRFRDQIDSEREFYVRKDQFEAFRNQMATMEGALKEKIGSLEKSLANIEGRFWVIGIGGLLVGLAAIVVRFIK